jgi:protein CpxP
MKKIILTLAIAALGTGAASANAYGLNALVSTVQQGGGQMATPQERAQQLTARMTEVLALTAEQTPKIQELNVKRFTEQQAMREKMQAGGDREAMMTAFRGLTEKYNAQYKTILTPEQYTKYEANQDQFRGGRGGAPRPQGQ